MPEDERFSKLQHWRVVENEFPFDKVAQRSWIVMPRRCVALWEKLTGAERSEFQRFRSEAQTYDIDAFLRVTPTNLSLPGHYHEHILKL